MVETPAYFEAYRYVLEGLQEQEEDNLPFQRYIRVFMDYIHNLGGHLWTRLSSWGYVTNVKKKKTNNFLTVPTLLCRTLC